MLGIGMKKPMVVGKAEWEKDCQGPAKEPIGKLFRVLVFELLRIVLFGGLLVIQVAVAVLSEIRELLESSVTCRKYAIAKRATQATCTRGKNLRNSKSLKNLKNFGIREKKKKKKRKKES